MRMVHRAGIFLPDNAFYLFKSGTINGITWTGSADGYSSYTINSSGINVRAYLWNGVSGSGSSSVITYVDLRGFKHVGFTYNEYKTVSATAPNIRVYPNYVSLSTGTGSRTAIYDLSAIPDLSNQLIMIQSGHVSKSSTSGVVDSVLTVTAVWATRD